MPYHITTLYMGKNKGWMSYLSNDMSVREFGETEMEATEKLMDKLRKDECNCNPEKESICPFNDENGDCHFPEFPE